MYNIVIVLNVMGKRQANSYITVLEIFMRIQITTFTLKFSWPGCQRVLFWYTFWLGGCCIHRTFYDVGGGSSISNFEHYR